MSGTEATAQEPSPETLRAFLAAPVDFPEVNAATVGELFSLAALSLLREGAPFADWKCAVYLAGVRAGVIPGTATEDGRLTRIDAPAALAMAEAAVRFMGQPPADTAAAAVRAMITAKRLAVADAGISRGLAPDWHEATFTAAEIEAAITRAADRDGP
jgi:hypothetical protein